jgi:hypothetical protein
MLSQEHTTIGKLKQAYGLNEQDVERLLSALPAEAILPYELWHKAFTKFWSGPADASISMYSVKNFSFPSIITFFSNTESIEKARERTAVLFIDLSKVISATTLKKGLDYVILETYDNYNEYLYFSTDIEILFTKLYEEEKSVKAPFIPYITIKEFHSLVYAKCDVRLDKYAFISQLFYDAIVVNKEYAKRHIDDCGYSMQKKIKGLYDVIVDRLSTTSSEQTSKEALPPDFAVPKILWKGKLPSSIRDAMRSQKYPDSVIALVLHECCGKDKTSIGKTLGKPNKSDSTYLRLGTQLLEEAASLTIVIESAPVPTSSG